MKKCTNCQAEFNPRNEWQKYCSNLCRANAFKAKNEQKNESQERMNNERIERTISLETLERLLEERDRTHAAEIAKLQAEFKTQTLESRLLAIEEKLKETEADEEPKGIAGLGFGLPEIVQAYMTYQTMKQATNGSGTDEKKG